MNTLKKILLERLSRYAHRRGVDIYLEDFSVIRGLSLKNIDIDACGQRMVADTCRGGIKLKELFRKKIVVKVVCKNITLMPGCLSNKAFQLSELRGSFSYEKRLKEAGIEAILNQSVHLSFKTTAKEGEREFFAKASAVSIDKYKQLFDGHIISSFMKTICSDTPVTVLAYYKHEHTSPYPRIRSTFQYDALKICPDDCVLSKEYLIEELGRRNHLAKEYRTLEQIPELIRRTVICTEDPSFELHKGISPTLTGITLKTNIGQKALKRGGSTISMQLIKNALLNGERIFARKIEEAILTLLMENHYRVSKQDILEVYLNIIEFAPGVYGIEDAARFYFDKPSSQLSVIEIIVLTYIIPRPIHFYEALLQKSEQLRRNLLQHIRLYLGVLLKKQFIAQAHIPTTGNLQIEFSDRFGVLPLDV